MLACLSSSEGSSQRLPYGGNPASTRLRAASNMFEDEGVRRIWVAFKRLSESFVYLSDA